MSDLPATVLFACTYNASRSPMAEALLRHFHGLSVTVRSVGVFKGDLDPFAVAAMDEIGIDITRHRPWYLHWPADVRDQRESIVR